MSQLNPNTKKKGTKKQPTDWPAEGPIDLAVHDLPHASSTEEYWNLNCHLANMHGRHFSLFASFTRSLMGKDEHTGAAIYTHSVCWALTDTDTQQYHPCSRTDRVDALAGNSPLQLVIDHNSLHKIQEGKYQLKLHNPETGVGCELNFMPFVNPVLHGNNGQVTGTRGEAMFYYFIPGCEVNGTITLPQAEAFDVTGCGWYDHRFGKPQTPRGKKQQLLLNWFSIQLENNWQITAYELIDCNKQPALFGNDTRSTTRWGMLIDPDGNAAPLADFLLTPGATWASARTCQHYPIQWRLAIPEYYIDLELRASQPDQEFITVIDKPAFWQGRLHAVGRFGKRTVNGLGYAENR